MPVGNSLGMHYEDDLEKELDHIERGPYAMPDNVIDARSMDQDIDGIPEGEKSIRAEQEFSNGIQNSVGRIMNPRFASGMTAYDPGDVTSYRTYSKPEDNLPREYQPGKPSDELRLPKLEEYSKLLDKLETSDIGNLNPIEPLPRPKDMKDHSDFRNTPLSPEEQKNYDGKFSPKDKYDYDMQGWLKDHPNEEIKPGVHFPDTYKKPNHPTFSDESKYHGQDGTSGGHWGKEDGKDTFTPGETNMNYHTKKELEDYFAKHEPDVKLKWPKAK